jgi:hypothetical protein
MIHGLRDRIFNIKSKDDFQATAFEIYQRQSVKNKVYHDYISYLGKKEIYTISDIPFLPIEFFRNHKVLTDNSRVAMVFESSGTTGIRRSRHYVTDPGMYEKSFSSAFRLFYGEPAHYCIAALLPSYTERGNSSLVYMVRKLIEQSGHRYSGFYNDNRGDKISKLCAMAQQGTRVLLIGVTFALLDLALDLSPDLGGAIVMETGGMKGRRKELTREELHAILMRNLNIGSVHSEYGMTELLSQAYSKGGGIFNTPPWMKILIRDTHDPLSVTDRPGITGGINIIDLANINSCSFLATGDLGRLREDGGFEILGRFDNSDIRGCSLLTE